MFMYSLGSGGTATTPEITMMTSNWPKILSLYLMCSPTSKFHMFFSPPSTPSPIHGEGNYCNPSGFPSLDGRG